MKNFSDVYRKPFFACIFCVIYSAFSLGLSIFGQWVSSTPSPRIFFIPVFFRQLDNRLPLFYSYCRIGNILSAERHDNCIINLIEKENIMNLATFNPEQALDSFFDTKRFFRFPRTLEEQSIVLTKVNVIEKDDAFHLEAENHAWPRKRLRSIFVTAYWS